MSLYWMSGGADRYKLSFSPIYSPQGLIIEVTLELVNGCKCIYKILLVIGFKKNVLDLMISFFLLGFL